MALPAPTAQHRPARVLFFCPTLGDGGADRVVLTLLERLDRARIAPRLAVVRRAGALIDDVPADVPTFELGSRRLLVAAPDLARLIRRERPDVVFSTHGGSNIIAALAHALAGSRSRLVLSERSALVREDRGRVRRALEVPAKRVTYRRADLVTAVSAGVARELESRLGLPAAKIRVVYNPAVDDDLAARAAEAVAHPWFAPGAAAPVIVAVGRLVAIKDYPTLLSAFARIRAARPARLFVLGDGPLRAELEARVRAAGLAGDVELFGFDKNPLKYMARARLLLHASRAEGLPGALIQAMACGTPVVSTDCDHGPREVIARPGHDGFLVPVGDAAALAEHALALLGDHALAARVSTAARESARRFGIAAALAQYEAAITGAPAPGEAAPDGGSDGSTRGGARTVTFVFSNPRHHLDMMVPVARRLGERGVPYRFVSLAELRGFPTPSLAERLPGADVRRAIPRHVRRDPSAGAGIGTSGGRSGGTSGDRVALALARLRRTARAAVWRAVLRPRLRQLLRGSSVAVVPNDAAYPYAELAADLRARGVPFVLLQEGIRFPLPAEDAAGLAYGKGGAAAVCAWGEASAEHFRAIGVPAETVHVTGSPRFDGVAPEAWRERGRALAAELGLPPSPLLYLSNTIDDQGFCTTAAKLDLFAGFVREAAPVLQRSGRALVVKLHPREDTAAFRRAAAAFPDVPIHVLPLEAPLFAVLAMGRAAVVLASTVGLEAIAFGLPLGVLAIPGHGHVFEYVARGAAEGLVPGAIADGVARLCEAAPPPAAAPFLERHLAHRGEAAARIADRIAALTTTQTARTS